MTIRRAVRRLDLYACNPKSFTSLAGSSQRLFQSNLNYRNLRNDPSHIQSNLTARRITDINLAHIISLNNTVSKCEFEVSELRKRRNQIAADMAELVKQMARLTKSNASADAIRACVATKTRLIQAGKNIKQQVQATEETLSKLHNDLFNEAKHLPNDVHPSVPVGDESKAVLVDTIGSPRTLESNLLMGSQSPLKTHLALAELHDMVDIDRAGKVSGSRFYYLRNAGAMLEMALVRYAMDICIQRGFTPVLVPDLIRHEVLEACGFSPRSDDPQTYYVSTCVPGKDITNTDNPMTLCLSATAEFPLAGKYAGEVLDHLPINMSGMGRAFRAEGLSGSTNRGLYRVHQFTKVELFTLARPTESMNVFHHFIQIQKEIFQGLEICFRILNMPTEELGAPAYIKYDMEAWMPGRNAWGEISSTSNCTDYQSRRLNIRCFPQSGASNKSSNAPDVDTHTATEFVHTINGTACAVPRLMIALLETHQLPDGSIRIPEKLRKYFLGAHVDVLPVGKRIDQLMAQSTSAK
ncbi:Serine--tRNA ligase, mitochondrial [Batrachochytrium dendrobatidis]|nr:Serine--tRNA ligase, mitochondrial [Batrachochytrium dendrobatidis]KAK5672776.1 Serine--tRNA ligase, mitochondrial [Batrachochytrium dendrobatidis]